MHGSAHYTIIICLNVKPSGAVAVRNAFFGRPEGQSAQFIITQVTCRGSEARLIDCMTNPSDMCGRLGAGVICSSEPKTLKAWLTISHTHTNTRIHIYTGICTHINTYTYILHTNFPCYCCPKGHATLAMILMREHGTNKGISALP